MNESWPKQIYEPSRFSPYMMFELFWPRCCAYPSPNAKPFACQSVVLLVPKQCISVQIQKLHNISNASKQPRTFLRVYFHQHLRHSSTAQWQPHHHHAQSATLPTPNSAPHASPSPTAPPRAKSSTGRSTKPSVKHSPPSPLAPRPTTNSQSTSLSPPPPHNSRTSRARLKPTRTTARRSNSPTQMSYWKLRTSTPSINTAGSSSVLRAMCYGDMRLGTRCR